MKEWIESLYSLRKTSRYYLKEFMMGHLAINISISLIKAGVFVYDLLTYPIYAIVSQPWKNEKNGHQQAQMIPSSEGICYHTTRTITNTEIELVRNNVDTVHKVHEFAFSKYGDKEIFGTRKILREFSEPQPNGKIFKKYEMGDYTWLTYAQANEIATNFGCGLCALGHQPKENLIIFSETRVEWLLSAIGAFKQNIPICTLYATLGEEALIHGINETEVRHMIVSHDLMPRLKKIIGKCPNIKRILYLPDQLNATDTSGFEGASFNSFDEVIEMGKSHQIKDCPPSPNDVAIIMYTSGSTGTPKGVIMSHANLVHSIGAFAVMMVPIPQDIYLAYLPLAHVLELIGETIMMVLGVPLGYSSPLTMTDRSTKIKRGCKGDVSILQPTIFPTVPLILDRIYKGILEKVAAQGPFLKALFDFGLKYKNNWSSRGWPTPICDWFVFRKIRALMGGRVRVIATGGAPLSPETHNFVRASLGAAVIQGYGLTETCACATLMNLDDMSTNRVGSPLTASDIKLVDWEEGNYRVTDKPNPRGEVVIGGENVCVGYYKNPQKTQEDFYDMDGRRWFRTGDIGEFDSDGVLKIIDRKKDLVKLQIGEYVSLGKVEAELKVCPLVENLCVYAESIRNNVVVIVSPDVKNLKNVAASLNKDPQIPLEKLCQDKDIMQAVLKELAAIGLKAKLEKFEVPTALHLTSEVWTPDSGLVTAAFKLKRKQIQNKYQDAINRMYGA